MRVFLVVILYLHYCILWSQGKICSHNHSSISNQQNTKTQKDSTTAQMLEWFQGGNIDFISSGLLRSSANVLVLNLGNPDKFYLPFYLLIGATTDIFQDGTKVNESSMSDLLNNYGGFINFGINGKTLIQSSQEHSQLHISYQLGAKSITGLNIAEEGSESFLSKMINLGLIYNTLAWTPDMPEQYGRAWCKVYGSISHNNAEKMKNMFGPHSENILFGANFEGGVELENFVSLRFGYYKYLNNHHIPYFDEGIFKLAADFMLAAN